MSVIYHPHTVMKIDSIHLFDLFASKQKKKTHVDTNTKALLIEADKR